MVDPKYPPGQTFQHFPSNQLQKKPKSYLFLIIIGVVFLIGLIFYFNSKEDNSNPETIITKNTEVENFNGVLEEKKYAIVYAFQEDYPDFDSQGFSEDLINNANDYFTEVSYGKMNINYWYVTSIISNEIPNELGPCVGEHWSSYIVNLLDPLIDFKEYYGIITIFEKNTENPFWNCRPHGTIGRLEYNTNEGKIQLSFVGFPKTKTPEKPFSPPSSNILAHEIGHNLGLNHAYMLDCNDNEGNKVTIGNNCNFVSEEHYDPMGSASKEHYNIRNKLILGWLEKNNVPEVTKGTYWITPINSQFQNKSEIKGLMIPKKWGEAEFPEIAIEFFSHYFLEYKLINQSGFQPTKGVFIRFGNYIEDEQTSGWYTVLLNMHPKNSIIYTDYGAPIENMYVYLEKNQNYTDEYNKMVITVLDANESGALVEIQNL
ncbi:MAG: hypothetical protein KKF48_01015 [Nanoarchaeota archaeon]|nr:hypothetical protein [Nanoarchaeota archaeon]MBU1027604.1 hypothetical protein [Nanoarchaeota archaeon]